jgi:tRNA 2-thiouridine synthesizing protein A
MLSIKKVREKSYGLDLRRFVCPYPQMYTSQALAKLPRGSVFKVIIDKPRSRRQVCLCKFKRRRVRHYN